MSYVPVMLTFKRSLLANLPWAIACVEHVCVSPAPTQSGPSWPLPALRSLRVRPLPGRLSFFIALAVCLPCVAPALRPSRNIWTSIKRGRWSNYRTRPKSHNFSWGLFGISKVLELGSLNRRISHKTQDLYFFLGIRKCDRKVEFKNQREKLVAENVIMCFR